MLTYIQPPVFTTGQILGRSVAGILRDNDDFFNSLGDRYRPVVAGSHRGFIGEDTNPEGQDPMYGAWDGWHLLDGDAETLNYWFKIENSHPSDLTRASLYYNYTDSGDRGTLIATQNGDGVASGTADLSGFDPGIYRVFCRMWRDDMWNGSGSTVTVRAPYTQYTGDKSYTAGHTITDGSVSSADHFNRWKDNDLYFNDISPRQVAFVGLTRDNDGTITTLFDGWTKWHPNCYRLYYSVNINPTYNPDLGNNRIRIVWDYDDVVSKEATTITDTGTTTGYWDIGSPTNWTKGTFYRVRVHLVTDDVNFPAVGTVYRLHWTAPALDAAYTVMDPFAVNQYVFGSTAGELSRLDYLTDNDASIYDRLAWGSATPGRMDHACYRPRFVESGGDVSGGNYRFVRRGAQLYYRVTGATLTKVSGDTEGLDDYDDDNPFQVLDLNSVDVPYGTVYALTGTLEAAWEI